MSKSPKWFAVRVPGANITTATIHGADSLCELRPAARLDRTEPRVEGRDLCDLSGLWHGKATRRTVTPVHSATGIGTRTHFSSRPAPTL